MSSYSILGISQNATDDDVRRAYKHKALECHPDRNMNDKDAATRLFIQVNAAYHAILRERERKAARSKSATSDQKRASTASDSADTKAGPSKSSPSPASSAHSTPASTPSSSPFSTPTSSPYSTPASSPASSTTSLPDDEKNSSFRSSRSATCEDVDDEDDVTSTAGSSTPTHTKKPPPDSGRSKEAPSSSSKTRRSKLRKPQPKPKTKPEQDAYHSSDECECSCHRPSSSKKSHDTASTSHDHSDTRSHHTKRKETELKDYCDTLPSLKDYPTADLEAEWVYPLSLSLEDIFHGKRLCYRITRRYLSGKTKGVVLDVDVPAGCRTGTKIVFRDAGHERRNGSKQDLVFLVQVAKHERFVRGSQRDNGSRERRKSRDSSDSPEREKESESGERRPHRRRDYGEEDLIMQVDLPWVDRLKDEKARIVVSGIDEEELSFEVDCRNGNADSKGSKMTGVYIIEGAGMPVRGNAKGARGDTKSRVSRGNLIIRWEILAPASSSSSKWENFKQLFTFGK